jgi:long-subunit fatty acid transport protein
MTISDVNKPTFLSLFVGILCFSSVSGQIQSGLSERVHFGGSLGLSIGSGFTNIVVAPSVIYDVNQYFSAGAGLQGSYVNWQNNFESFIYGASIIGLVNPIEQVQLSAELEQLRVNTTYEDNFKDNFWNTALFLGAGYRTNNVTVGVRYNVLFKERNNVYNEAFMPFIRVYF